MDDKTNATAAVSRLDLLFITRAYNRQEITLAEWIQLSKAWAEAMVRQHSERYIEDGRSHLKSKKASA